MGSGLWEKNTGWVLIISNAQKSLFLEAQQVGHYTGKEDRIWWSHCFVGGEDEEFLSKQHAIIFPLDFHQEQGEKYNLVMF